jgi:hypothetical protein
MPTPCSFRILRPSGSWILDLATRTLAAAPSETSSSANDAEHIFTVTAMRASAGRGAISMWRRLVATLNLETLEHQILQDTA